jgi:hypothetical protein
MMQVKRRVFVFLSTFAFIAILGAGGAYGSVTAEGTADVEGLIKALNEADDPCSVAESLSKTGDLRALPPLVELIKRHKDKQVQACAAKALASLDTKKSVALLIAELNNPDVHAASRSALALGIIKDDAAVDPLLKALFESNFSNSAALALGMIKAPRSLEPLIGALKHTDESIRGCAVIGLIVFGDKKACKALTDLFVSEWQAGDEISQWHALLSIEKLQCSFEPSQIKQYSLPGTVCSKAQQLLDVLVPILDKKPLPGEWEAALSGKQEILASIYPQESADFENPEVRQQILILQNIFVWAEAVVSMRSKSDAWEKCKVKLRTAEMGLLCPKIKLPDYTH